MNLRTGLTAVITDYRTITPEQTQKPYVVYSIACEYELKQWTVDKRYSEFESLQSELSTRHDNLPKLPPKLLFGNMNASNLGKRKIALQTYLDTLIQDESVSLDEDLDIFLQVSKQTQNPLEKKVMQEGHDVFVALYDHIAKVDTELTFKRGDKITLSKMDGTTYYGSLKSNPQRIGCFPSNYVQSIYTVNHIASKTPPKFQPLFEPSYEIAQEEKSKEIGKIMRLSVEHHDDRGTLKVYDRVRIIVPSKNDEIRKNCSYIRHLKKNIDLWIPDECLCELPSND
jgi:hypothetical protein